MTTYLVCSIQHVSSKLTGNAQESVRTYYVRTFVRLGCPNLTRKVFAHPTLARSQPVLSVCLTQYTNYCENTNVQVVRGFPGVKCA